MLDVISASLLPTPLFLSLQIVIAWRHAPIALPKAQYGRGACSGEGESQGGRGNGLAKLRVKTGNWVRTEWPGELELGGRPDIKQMPGTQTSAANTE